MNNEDLEGLEEVENMDWMSPGPSKAQDPGQGKAAAAPLPPVSTTPWRGSAWPSWCTPSPTGRPDAGTSSRMPPSAKKAAEHHSALALAYAKKAATEKEEAACIAAKAKAQMQLSAMNSVLKRQGHNPKTAQELEKSMEKLQREDCGSPEPTKIMVPTAETTDDGRRS